MKKVRVRKNFNVQLAPTRIFAEGVEFDCTSEEYDLIAHQVELIVKNTKASSETL
jgi:hypothetical protein